MQENRNMTDQTGSQPDGMYMEVLQLAGRIIMENGGETYRAEETVNRMGTGLGLEEVDSFAVPSGLFISYRGRNGDPVTGVRRVRQQDRNLTRVNDANQVSREIVSGSMDCGEAYRRLRYIEKCPGDFPGLCCLPAAFLCAAGFSTIFGGAVPDILIAGTVAAIVQLTETFVRRNRSRGLAASVLGGLLTTLLPYLLHIRFPALQTEIIIAGAIMPLVPGLAMANAVQDAMRGDMLSGLSHGVKAIITACMIAGGTLLAMGMMNLMAGG